MTVYIFCFWLNKKFINLDLMKKVNFAKFKIFLYYKNLYHLIFNLLNWNVYNNWKSRIYNIRADVPLAWGLYFQDGASPSFEGIVDLHNRIMFYLVVILFGVTWVMLSIIWNFNKSYNKLVYRYLNHGKNVPIQKYSKFDNTILKSKRYIPLRFYTTSTSNPLYYNDTNVVKVYEDVYDMKKDILKENKGKSLKEICIKKSLLYLIVLIQKKLKN